MHDNGNTFVVAGALELHWDQMYFYIERRKIIFIAICTLKSGGACGRLGRGSWTGPDDPSWAAPGQCCLGLVPRVP
jgi:hypothetical protein